MDIEQVNRLDAECDKVPARNGLAGRPRLRHELFEAIEKKRFNPLQLKCLDIGA